ncbi:phosphate acetyltransferase [Agaribacterium sp. ZY112]|uniref:phosphate acetyltransferase n=1 Tax=Agaribacterium sp. ZY112 TaxID=3233574 RepID=UPI003523B5AF
MIKSFFLAPAGSNVGLTSATLGLVRALDQVGLKVGFCKPIAQHADNPDVLDPSLLFLNETQQMDIPTPILLSEAQQRMAGNEMEDLMEDVVQLCQNTAKDVDVLVVEGLVPQDNAPFIARINATLARTLDSHVILVAAQNHQSFADLNRHIDMTANYYGGTDEQKVLGCVLNKVGAPEEYASPIQVVDDVEVPQTVESIAKNLVIFDKPTFRCIGEVPWYPSAMAPRVSDIAAHLGAESLNPKARMERRVKSVSILARTIANSLNSLKANTLVIVPGDRHDLLIAAGMAVVNGVPLAGLLLTGNLRPSDEILQLCHAAFEARLPVLLTNYNTIHTARKLDQMSINVPRDDIPRINRVMDYVAERIDASWLAERVRTNTHVRLSPAAFRHNLVERAREENCRIVLPEGEEPRTIRAATTCHRKKIARCVLLGNPDQIRHIAEMHSIELPDDIELKDPKAIREDYVDALVEARKHKGLTPPMALSILEDPIMIGTVMLKIGEVDGLVSGAVNTTANTIRPALQLIKTSPDAKIASSVFFMCLPDQVVVYGDCAVNPDPSAEELADIAIQSGDSAAAFGIEPKIAMISYSTGASGIGTDVEKVREATKIAKAKRPDLLIDGPLQYDAATVASVAKSKAPESLVAGQATVFIFPDLNTGNTTYKAVQRSAQVGSIGPMLQGLNKPVNDLSRGALVDDIVYTIALTAVQAGQRRKAEAEA